MHNKPIDELISKIIPPNDREHRENINNEALIDQLTESEKNEVESRLLVLLAETGENLVACTLAYMKSLASIPIIHDCMQKSDNLNKRILLASYIYYIRPDRRLIDVVVSAYYGLSGNLEKALSFYPLRTFHSPETDAIIKENISSREYLISYHAKRAMAIDVPLIW